MLKIIAIVCMSISAMSAISLGANCVGTCNENSTVGFGQVQSIRNAAKDNIPYVLFTMECCPNWFGFRTDTPVGKNNLAVLLLAKSNGSNVSFNTLTKTYPLQVDQTTWATEVNLSAPAGFQIQ